MAMRAGLDPTPPEALTAFDIQVNPADRLPSLAQFSKALDGALTLPELHAFWRRREAAADSPSRDALMNVHRLRPSTRLQPSMESNASAGHREPWNQGKIVG
jgi:hypothetical protein